VTKIFALLNGGDLAPAVAQALALQITTPWLQPLSCHRSLIQVAHEDRSTHGDRTDRRPVTSQGDRP